MPILMLVLMNIPVILLIQTSLNLSPDGLDNPPIRQQARKQHDHIFLPLDHHNKVVPHLEAPKCLVDQDVLDLRRGYKSRLVPRTSSSATGLSTTSITIPVAYGQTRRYIPATTTTTAGATAAAT